MQQETQQLAVLSAMEIERIRKQPIIQTQMMRSEDGKWFVHRTITTDIKPMSYIEKVLADK